MAKDLSSQNAASARKMLLTWSVALFLIIIAVWFLHEMGHGFGYRLEGIHVSTGFNLVGASGKKPNDPDFNIGLLNDGLGFGLLLGPLVNWLLAILFTTILVFRSQPDFNSLLIGVMAVANAFMRLMPLVFFIVPALFGNLPNFQDEQKMSLGAIEGITLPISDDDLRELADSQPSLFLKDPDFYFWTTVSFAISLACFVFAYRHLYRLFGLQLNSRAQKVIFGLMPFILFFPIFGAVSFLDNAFRINW